MRDIKMALGGYFNSIWSKLTVKSLEVNMACAMSPDAATYILAW